MDFIQLRRKIHELKIFTLNTETYIQEDLSHSENSPVTIKRKDINSSLNSIGIVEIINADLSENCSICLEKIRENTTIRKLFCGHKFHKSCIDEWLYPLYHNDHDLLCPLCRQNIE